MLNWDKPFVVHVSAGLTLLIGATLNYSRDIGVPATTEQLARVVAGQYVRCESPQVYGPDCIDCQPNGNNGYVKCDTQRTTSYCMTFSNSYCLECQDANSACGGNIITYPTEMDCQQNMNGVPGGACLRDYPNAQWQTCDGNCFNP